MERAVHSLRFSRRTGAASRTFPSPCRYQAGGSVPVLTGINRLHPASRDGRATGWDIW